MNAKNDILYFTSPAEKWEHYLPLGNGRLGVMQKAHPCNETLQLNEEGIWSGGPADRTNPDTLNFIEEIRQLVRQGKVLEAQELGFRTMSGTCVNERVYQTAGDLKIDFYSANNYGIECGFPLQHKTPETCLKTLKTQLDLSRACTELSYTDENGVNFTRRTWIPAPADMIFMHIKADRPHSINFRANFDRGIWVDNMQSEKGFIKLEDSHGIPFCAMAGAVCNPDDGKIITQGACLAATGCTEVLLFVDIQAYRWNKKEISKKQYDKIIQKNYWSKKCLLNMQKMTAFIKENGVAAAAESLFQNHLKEYSKWWNRMEVKIGSDINNQQNAENDNATLPPTPAELLKNAGRESTQLVNLYCNFSRYLLIAGSRKPGMLPTTLQGLWNCYMDPPWGSKYTININTEMNYWPVNMANLSECEDALFELLERAYEKGRYTAKKMYGCKGYVLHHNTDYWGDAAPQDAWLPGTYWTLGAAWLATHIYEHFEYTQDITKLKKHYYLIHEACQFFADFLIPTEIKAPDGQPYLAISPSVSPENSYITKAGQTGAFSEGCEMDNMILEHLFKSCLKAKEILGNSAADKKHKKYDDDDFVHFEYILNHLKKPEMNSDGSLMEWNTEVPEVEPGHRHISHLYGLFPGHTITAEKTPELIKAAEKTLEKRLSNGGGHTGWSQAWIINFWAQLEKGDKALDAIVKLLTHSTLPNLLDNHPPFQIDGNFGTLAAVIRMLVQSNFDDKGNVQVKLLPALPDQKEWQSGECRGIRIKGGYTIDFNWEQGKIINYKINPGNNCIAKEKIIIR